MIGPISAALLLLQSAYQQPGALSQPARSSPPSGDTVGYWQQRVNYRIVARLDETAQRLRSRGELIYVNNSPDTLREMYFHQYLNAFRPGSKWSEADEREGRVRFQNLSDPDYGFERFTTPPTVNGRPVFIDYPGAPDSTVAHFRLPYLLLPHDSVRITLEWEARPSTVPRRQGRRGRTWDFAQWYPKVAVYDRGGWEPNPLVPAGEFYGEYGTYDVTMVVPEDQVLASTGVPLEGDPGWEKAKRGGDLRLARDAYSNAPAEPTADAPSGFKSVRFYARDVHHFAWSASPDYRYEGAVVVRELPRSHFKTWDTVSIHVLYKPTDDTTWGGGRAVNRTITALRWLESIWGPYAYPQMSNVHRLDGGGTEFPMMMMNGGASQNLILHEGGHIFTYGILGNNEWRSGWMDEGLTSYQTSWFEGQTPQERAKEVAPPPRIAQGYRISGVTMPRSDSTDLDMLRLELAGRTEPIGTNAANFSEFSIYNQMIYTRAELMYSHLRDVLGDSLFRSFAHGYYDKWALKHVDELAMRVAAERASGQDLGWFFNEWVHNTGLLDYALGNVRTTQGPEGRWVTRAEIVKRGDYRHPIAVGARTSTGWTLARGNVREDKQTVEIVTSERPTEVRIDPYHYTWDWDRRNDVRAGGVVGVRRPRIVFDWPFLNQADREHSIVGLFPMLWYSEPTTEGNCAFLPGCTVNHSAVTVGLRARSSYLSSIDKYDMGAAVTFGDITATLSHFNAWARIENPRWPFGGRPLIGVGLDLGFLDGIGRFNLRRTWDLSPYFFAPGPRITATARASGAYITDRFILPEQWQDNQVTEVGGNLTLQMPLEPDNSYTSFGAAASIGLTRPRAGSSIATGYVRAEGSATRMQYLGTDALGLVVRLYGAGESKAPLQRAIFASTQDPLTTFWDSWYRPRGSIDKQEWFNLLPLGGAFLRGYNFDVALSRVGAANVELTQRVRTFGGAADGRKSIWFSAFGDIAAASSDFTTFGGSMLLDAGVGASLRGRIYDRDVKFRVDLPIFVKQPGLAGGPSFAQKGSLAFRYVFSMNDLW